MSRSSPRSDEPLEPTAAAESAVRVVGAATRSSANCEDSARHARRSTPPRSRRAVAPVCAMDEEEEAAVCPPIAAIGMAFAFAVGMVSD